MLKCKIGDIVECRVFNKKIVDAKDVYSGTVYLRVIGYIIDGNNNPEYVAHVSKDDMEFVTSTLMVGTFLIRNYNVSEKYLSAHGVYLRNANIVSTICREDGAKCRSCTDFVYMAQPDRADGTFVCRRCRENPYV